MARILVIEDNPENLELMRFLLHAFGHEPVIARSGEEGLALASRQPPELIVCDIHMPQLDGYGVLARLGADPRLARIPCIAVTALAMLGDRNKVIEAGFDGYISKPIEPEKFVGEVEAFLHDTGGVRRTARTAWPAPAPREAPLGKFARVLVVDDSSTNRDLIEHTLSPFGYEVTTAETVSQGLALARRQPPDLIVSDLHMPMTDGFEFLKTLKAEARLAEIPFIFLSSSVWGDKDGIKAMELGANRFLQRPIEPQTLLREVTAILPLPPSMD
jgi:two-component system cell cycle response regulator